MTEDLRALESERDFLLDAIEELDRDHLSGTLNDAEYIDLRDQHVASAARVLRSIEAAVMPTTDVAKPVRAAAMLSSVRKQLWAVGVVVLVVGALLGAVRVVQTRDGGESITGSTVGGSATLLAKAQEQTANGRVSDAVRTYDRVLQIDPRNVAALTYRGWLVRLAGLPTDGLASIDQAIQIDPTYPDAHFFKGYILLNDQQNPKAAEGEFTLFLNNNPPQSMVPLVQQALKDAQARAALLK